MKKFLILVAPNKEESLLAADVLEGLAFITYSLGKPKSAESLFENATLAYEKRRK